MIIISKTVLDISRAGIMG